MSFFPIVAQTFIMSEEDACRLLLFRWGVLDATHFQSLNQMMIFEENVEKDGLPFIQGICFFRITGMLILCFFGFFFNKSKKLTIYSCLIAAGDKLAKLDKKLLFRKSREDSFVEINKKKVGEDTVIALIRNPSPGLALQDKVSNTLFRWSQ